LKSVENHELCGTNQILAYCNENFQYFPSQSWVSKFCKKNRMASHKTQKRPSKRDRSSYEQEISEFRAKLDSIRLKRKRGVVWTMDEAGIYDDAIVQRSYSPIRTTPQIRTSNSHGRDTIIATVSENGKKLPLYYVQHRRKKYMTKKNPLTKEKYKIIVDKGISGLTNEIMHNWINDFLAQPLIHPREDILLFDQHRSHLNQKNLKKLLDAGLEVLPFPKGAAAELSQCDNSLFRDFKRDFATAWCANKFKKEKKKETVMDVWEKFPEDRILGYWRKCGYPIKPTRRRRTEEKERIASSIKRTVANTACIETFFK
jgi:hypothetical protein